MPALVDRKEIQRRMQEYSDKEFLDCVLQRGKYGPVDPKLAEAMRIMGRKWCPHANDWVKI